MINLFITFVPLAENHFPLLVKWLNESHVRQWWSVGFNKTITLEVVTKNLLPRVNGCKGMSCYVVEINNVSVGYVQLYDARVFSREGYELSLLNAHIKDIHRLASMDLYIGDRDYVGKGYGSKIIRQFLREKAEQEYDACMVDIDVKNKVSMCVFEKVGFKKLTLLPLDNGMIVAVMLAQ